MDLKLHSDLWNIIALVASLLPDSATAGYNRALSERNCPVQLIPFLYFSQVCLNVLLCSREGPQHCLAINPSSNNQ
jgi:hypothetical protein